jgi:hypothetical protein
VPGGSRELQCRERLSRGVTRSTEAICTNRGPDHPPNLAVGAIPTSPSPLCEDELGSLEASSLESSLSRAAEESATRELRFEYANENRQATINLGGTGVAILTFLLVFLSDRYDAGGSVALLYRLTLGSIVFSIFFLGVSGSYYYFLIESLERKRPDTNHYLQSADACFVVGLGLLLAEPALILFTLEIYDIGTIAAVLWGLSLVLIARGRRRLG